MLSAPYRNVVTLPGVIPARWVTSRSAGRVSFPRSRRRSRWSGKRMAGITPRSWWNAAPPRCHGREFHRIGRFEPTSQAVPSPSDARPDRGSPGRCGHPSSLL